MKHEEILKQGLKTGTSNVLLHIDNPIVLNGSKCDCECPYCNAPLVARKEGKGGRYRQNIHHFAHAKGYEPCGKGGISALHILTQVIIKEECKVMLPSYDKKFVKKSSQLITFDEVTLEEVCKDEVSRRRPDCIGKVFNEGVEIWIEIYCTNPIDKDRREDIIRRQQYCIEIDFSDLLGTDYTKEIIRERLLNKSNDRTWICHPIWDKEEETKVKEEEKRLKLEEERKKKIAEALNSGKLKSIEEPPVEISVPQFTGRTPVPKEKWPPLEKKESNCNTVSEIPEQKDWLMWIKTIYYSEDGRKVFYKTLEKEYTKVNFSNSHPIVVNEAEIKINELLVAISVNHIEMVNKRYLEFLIVLRVVEFLNRHGKYELGKIFIENEQLRNAVLKIIGQLKSVTKLTPLQDINSFPVFQTAENKEEIKQILTICNIVK